MAKDRVPRSYEQRDDGVWVLTVGRPGREQRILVDAQDEAVLLGAKWYPLRDGNKTYAYTNVRVDGRPTTRKLHRVLLGLGRGRPLVDHVNGDGLDNRRANLRIASTAENLANRGKSGSGRSSRFKGVYLHKPQEGRDRWRAMIGYDGKTHHVGYYDSEEEAARAYDRAALAQFGEFAQVNFPAAAAPPLGRSAGEPHPG